MKLIYVYFTFLLVFFTHTGLQGSPVNPPVLEKVSVLNENGDVTINWQESTTTGVAGYIIYEYIGDFQGVNTILIDVVDNLQNNYTLTSSEANIRSISFVIAAFIMDGSDTIRSALTPPHRTIFLQPEWDPCTTKTELVWNSYTGWGNNLTGYRVSWFLQDDPIITNEAFINAPDTLFTHSNLPLNSQVCYFTEAYNSLGFNSVSNLNCIPTSVLLPPSYIHAAFATINSENQVEIQFYPDPDSQTDTYEIYRSSSLSGPYAFLARLNHFPPTSITYTDIEANPGTVNFYKLVGLNQCEIQVVESNPASNISLNISHNEGLNTLSWNGYETWPTGVQEYQIFRFSSNEPPSLKATLPGSSRSLTEDPTFNLQPGQSGEFCYLIKAVEGDLNPYGLKSVSISNTACAISEPLIYLPNAFTPDGDGINDFFTPFFTFLPAKYHMVIYDRWRNIIFESRDFNIHWDGYTRGGNKAPEAIYSYVLIIETLSGGKIQKTGQLALLYP
jgi:gliding motility-associated-like protein